MGSIFDMITGSATGMIVGVIVSILMGVFTNLFSSSIQSLIKRKVIPSMTNSLVELDRKLRTPKWYHNNPDAIDPGLIEVAVAITAVIIALPSFVNIESSPDQANLFRIFRFFGQFVPTVASINLLDRYAKNKGSYSKHILIAPISDGSFFLLGWSIILVFITISIVVFLVD